MFNAFYVACDESEKIVSSNLGGGTSTLSTDALSNLDAVPSELAPVPLPTAAGLMNSGLAGFGDTAYRGKTAATA